MIKNLLITTCAVILALLVYSTAGLYRDLGDPSFGGALDARNNQAYATASTTSVLTPALYQRLVATSTKRAYLRICNDTAGDMYIAFDDVNPAISNTMMIGDGACYEFSPLDGNLYTGSIRGSWDAALAGTTTVTQFFFQ